MTSKAVLLFCALLLLGITTISLLQAKPQRNLVKETGETQGLTLLAPDGAIQPNGHVVRGKAVVPTGATATVTLSGSAAFASSESYTCFFSQFFGSYRKVDGKQFVIPRQTDVSAVAVDYVCVGN